MNESSLTSESWPSVLAAVGRSIDLERSARDHGALRRCRGVASAEALLRLALRYGPGGLSLRNTAAWAQMAGVASLSDVALLKRLSGAAGWLCAVVDSLLPIDRVGPSGTSSRCIRLLDATSISRSRSTGTDWRLHAAYDLTRSRFTDFELTEAKGGEMFQRFPITEGDIVVGDRGYARHTGLRAVCDGGADFLVRAGWRTQRLLDASRNAIDLTAVYQQANEHDLVEQTVVIDEPNTGRPGIEARMIVLRKTDTQTQKSRKRILRKNQQKGRKTHPMSLAAANYLVLLTSLDPATFPVDKVLALYRMRWQIELAFKRLKSLIGIGRLPARDPGLARAWLAAHLIIALLIDAGTQKVLDSPPSATHP